MKEEKNPLKMARKKLYAKKNQIGDLRRIRLKKRKYDVNSDWQEKKEEKKVVKKKQPKKPMTFYTKFFIFSFAFFVISLFSAFVIFNSGANQITYEKVSVGIQGPNYISGGDTVSFIVSINNQNAVPIVKSDVYVIYPQGTVEPGSPTITMARDRESFEKILPGETKEVRFKAVMFGSEGENKKIQVRYEYRVENSNAIFHKDKDYEIKVSTAPVNVTSKHPSKVLSGDQIEVEIDVASNSTEDVSNLGLKIDYPFGFVYESAVPEPVSGNNIWDIGTVLAGANKTIKVKGTIGGQDGEERVFRYSVGSKDEENLSEIGSIFSSNESILSIKKPDFGVQIIADESEGDVNTIAGEFVKYKLSITNNLSTKILNPNIEAKIRGDIFDPRQIEVEDGFFDSGASKIVWSKQTAANFSSLEKGETKSFNFKIRVKDNIAGQVQNPEMTVIVEATGETFAEDGNEKTVFGSGERIARVASDVITSGKTVYGERPLTNLGPVPPRVGEETNYTIIWEAKTTTNDLTDVTMSALLPPYVDYYGVYTPSNENITFDEKKKEVVWRIGRLPAFTGYGGKDKKVYFMVGLKPSISQVGSNVVLLNEKRISGVDDFTKQTFSIKGGAETTELDDDSSEPKSGVVVE